MKPTSEPSEDPVQPGVADEPALGNEESDRAEQGEETRRSILAEVVAHTAAAMKATMAATSIGFTHNVLKGDGGESLVRAFLRDRLPDSIGITSGQIIDSTGATSKQIDVILYDATRTPMVFEIGYHHLVPAEGVIAAVEVKSRLSKKMLEGILANCASVKSLQRSAYFEQPTWPLHAMYGTTWTDAPIFYTVFAFNSDAMYAGPLDDLQQDLALEARVDTVCYLDRGVNLNANLDVGQEVTPTIEATARPGSGLIDIESDDALLLWYASLSSIVLQVRTRPINLLPYLADRLSVQGTMPTRLAEGMRERLIQHASGESGISAEALRKFSTGDVASLTPAEMWEMFRNPAFEPSEGATDQQALLFRELQKLAQRMTLEEWERRREQGGGGE